MKASFLQLVFFIKILSVSSNIVKLFDQIHFYEIVIRKNNKVDHFESFGYTVNGEGVCSHEIGKFMKPNKVKAFEVEAQATIYSNFEQTLSFLIEIEFQLKKKPSKFKLRFLFY